MKKQAIKSHIQIDMKRLLFSFLFAFTATLAVQAQSVLSLKNGSKIKGEVLEMDLSGNVKIQTVDGSVFVYDMEEVERVDKDNEGYNAKDNNTYTFPIEKYGKIDRHGSGLYWEDTGKELTAEECSTYLGFDLNSTYEGAHKQFNTGRTCMTVGLACLGMAVVFLTVAAGEEYYEDFEADADIATLFAYGADAGICLGCVFKGIGKHRLEWVKDTYNSGRYHANTCSPTLNFSPALMTAQNSLGMGASIVLRF